MFNCQVYPEAGVAVLKFFGTVDENDLIAADTYLFNEPTFKKDFDVVADCREKIDKVSVEGMKMVAESICAVPELSGKWVSLTGTSRATALAMIFSQRVVGHLSHGVYSTEEGCSSWLGKNIFPFIRPIPSPSRSAS